MSSETSLAGLERFDIIWGRQTCRSPKGVERVGADPSEARVLVTRRQLPRRDLHVVRPDGVERADRDGADKVDEREVGEDHQIPGAAHPGRPLITHAGPQLGPALFDQGLQLGRRYSAQLPARHDHGVPVSEIGTVAATRVEGCSGRHDHLEVSVVERQPVIAVGAVLDEQLPVRFDRVVLPARDHGHPLRGLVCDKIEVLGGAREIGLQVDNVGVEAHEPEAGVLFEPRRRNQGQVVAVERWAICGLIRQCHQRAGVVERPSVVIALEERAVPLPVFAQRGPAMRAGVHERSNYSVIATDVDDRPPPTDRVR